MIITKIDRQQTTDNKEKEQRKKEPHYAIDYVIQFPFVTEKNFLDIKTPYIVGKKRDVVLIYMCKKHTPYFGKNDIISTFFKHDVTYSFKILKKHN